MTGWCGECVCGGGDHPLQTRVESGLVMRDESRRPPANNYPARTRSLSLAFPTVIVSYKSERTINNNKVKTRQKKKALENLRANPSLHTFLFAVSSSSIVWASFVLFCEVSRRRF